MAKDNTYQSLAADLQVTNLVVTGKFSTANSINGNRAAFVYIATGAEGASFVVAFPAARSSTGYIARASGAGLAAFLVFDCPRAQYQADRCRLDCSAAPTAGDVIAITVEDLT